MIRRRCRSSKLCISVDQAVELWEDALEVDKNNIYANSFLGIEASRNEDYVIAHEHLKAAAARGSPSAQVELGNLYYEGVRHFLLLFTY